MNSSFTAVIFKRSAELWEPRKLSKFSRNSILKFPGIHPNHKLILFMSFGFGFSRYSRISKSRKLPEDHYRLVWYHTFVEFITNRHNFFALANFLVRKIGTDSVNHSDSWDIEILVQFSILKISNFPECNLFIHLKLDSVDSRKSRFFSYV